MEVKAMMDNESGTKEDNKVIVTRYGKYLRIHKKGEFDISLNPMELYGLIWFLFNEKFVEQPK